MGGKDCPLCGARRLTKLSNHLVQVHNMTDLVVRKRHLALAKCSSASEVTDVKEHLKALEATIQRLECRLQRLEWNQQ